MRQGHGREVRAGGWMVFGLVTTIAAPMVAVAADAPALVESTAETVTVTATRTATAPFEVPASIDVIGGEAFNQDTLGVNLSEGLGAVPGLLARDRQNYAQDTQISIRGFGSRATFGIRGLRLYLDGIPASQPDGQGQVSHFNLASADRVEVLRGPFSTLYGNSSGGVIQMFTADGDEPTRVTVGGAAGSFDTWRTNVGASGRAGSTDYTVDYTHFETDGYRDHSQAERDSLNGKVNIAVGTDGRLTLLGNYFDSPDVQDPLGLTRAQYDDDPEQVTPEAEQFNTRKSVRQTQGGAIYEHRLGANNSLRLLGYGGNREVEQYLSIPVGPQNGPFHSGGVVDLDSDYYGGDLRWTWRGLIDGKPLTVVAGTTYDELSQDRRGYQNFVTDGQTQVLGVRGALKRDEVNDIYNFDQYVQASFEVGERGSVMAGLRRSKVTFDSDDKFVVGTNLDDSGRREFSEVTPAVGVMYRLRPDVHLYGSFARGFETPTFAELAYRPDGLPGLNFALEPSTSANSEVGLKWRAAARTRVNVALFNTDIEDEIVVATNTGGRSAFQNAGRTGRRGVEIGIESRPVGLLNLQLAWTLLDAQVREDYLTCTGTPCPVATTLVERGNDIPGVPESSLFGAVGWGADTGLRVGVDARYLDAVPVNDVNSASAPSYTLVGADLAYGLAFGWGRVRVFVRGDNLFDEEYVGSVIVNDGNSRFYEPGTERSVLAGMRIDWNP